MTWDVFSRVTFAIQSVRTKVKPIKVVEPSSNLITLICKISVTEKIATSKLCFCDKGRTSP